MSKRALQIAVSVMLAAAAFWLSLRSLDVQEVIRRISDVELGWIVWFLPIMLMAHLLRALRWRMLLAREAIRPPIRTLFTGVLLGYAMNLVVPRLGEVTRPVYVARKLGIRSGMLFGTILLERLVDVSYMATLFLIVAFVLVRDQTVLPQVFGVESLPTFWLSLVPLAALAVPLVFWLVLRHAGALEARLPPERTVARKLLEAVRSFSEGIASIRSIPSWPLFLLCSFGIWFSYILMTLIPLGMLDLDVRFDLGLQASTVITLVSSIGILIPTPGGLGTYHLFVQQAMHLIYGVPLVEGLTYATVNHGVTALLTLVITPLMLWIDKNAGAVARRGMENVP